MEETTKHQGEVEPKALFGSNAERVVSFKLKSTGKIIRHAFRPPSREDAVEFFKRREVKQEDGSYTLDIISPMLQLYAKLAIRAEGYLVKGGGHLCNLNDWKQRVPRNDRFAAIHWLTRVIRDTSERTQEVDPDHDVIFLASVFGEAAPGEMRWLSGLAHIFEPMTAEDDLELNRKLTRGMILGGSRNGATVRPLRQKILLDLYDKKIRSTEGYAETLPGDIDPFHKLEAIEQLVSAVSDVEVPLEMNGAENA